ncbi:hypothetical protein CCUS01_16944 [Colletotrichum cuscutae]|uniref:Uncharacterized protein n=1 Tax=Colletotrichum cuscutae TaxID=1209917 RepID=A0AAI9Y5H8_9PEZI|nr:hypothetical protein CCUS01_16944 [Colletotrichum cuscutae]
MRGGASMVSLMDSLSALPDTGSDVMVMSKAYAISRGFNIDRNLQKFLDLELADGSEAFTCGLVRGVDWTFAASRQSVKCDFYVLEDLCTNVVLTNDFLFGVDVFSTESEFLSKLPYSEDYSELLLISLKGNCPAELPPHEDLANIDQIALVVTSADAFSRQRVLAELHHRDEVDNLIDALDPGDQETARRAEFERRRSGSRYILTREHGGSRAMPLPGSVAHNVEVASRNLLKLLDICRCDAYSGYLFNVYTGCEYSWPILQQFNVVKNEGSGTKLWHTATMEPLTCPVLLHDGFPKCIDNVQASLACSPGAIVSHGLYLAAISKL